MLFLVGNGNDTTSIRNLILSNIDEFKGKEKHNHDLYILTCYINLELIKNIVSLLRKKIKLQCVYLMFDRSQIFKPIPVETNKRLTKLQKWCNNLNSKIEFKWKVISGSSNELVHAKGYAVIQRIGSDERINNGFLIITSGNFTHKGFLDKGNIELAYQSIKKNDLKQFETIFKDMWENLGKEIPPNEDFLKYVILSQGKFLNKWDDNLSNLIGVRYKLTEKAKNLIEVKDKDLLALGFEYPQDTIIKQYLDVSRLPLKPFPGRFIANYTIKTFLGRWCPYNIWCNVIEQWEDNLGQFIIAFRKVVSKDKIQKARIEAEKIENFLSERGLIDISEGYLDRWERRVQELSKQPEMLRRIYVRWEDFDLPYQYSDTKEIDILYKSLFNSITYLKTNIIKEKTMALIKSRSVDEIKLSNNEKERLLSILRRE